MKTICGIDCSECVAARCDQSGGEKCFLQYKKQLLDEVNSLKIKDMPPVTTLFQLSGAYVNLEYTLPNGEKIKLLDDRKIYLGCQVEKANSDRGYGFVADNDYLLICEYGCNGAEPEIVVYKKR